MAIGEKSPTAKTSWLDSYAARSVLPAWFRWVSRAFLVVWIGLTIIEVVTQNGLLWLLIILDVVTAFIVAADFYGLRVVRSGTAVND
jgi:hypothetical protein